MKADADQGIMDLGVIKKKLYKLNPTFGCTAVV